MKDLTKDTLNAVTLGDVVFCSVAEGGAMGSPGTVIFANQNNEWFDVNFCFGDVSYNEIVDAFPVLKLCGFGMFGMDAKIPNGWHYIYLGYGNHLIICDTVYRAFMAEMGNDKTPPEIYSSWEKCASKVLTGLLGISTVPQEMTVISDLVVYGPAPEPGDDISQEITINSKGQVWFSSTTIENQETWNEAPHKKAQARIDPQKAADILSKVYDAIVYQNNHVVITDVGSWNIKLTLEDGNCIEAEGSMNCDEMLNSITGELRSLLPELNIAGFGYPDDDDFSDVEVGTEVYNTTFGYGKIKSFVGDTVRVTFDAGIKAFKYPDSFEKKILVRAEDASTCSEPLSPISSIQIENYSNFGEINTEQITVWLKKKKGRINWFKDNFILCDTDEFVATETLRKYLFELVTQIDRQTPWHPEYDPCIDDTGVTFTFTYSTGHSKHVKGNVSTIPYMEQIEGLFRLMMTQDLFKDDDISYIHGTTEPVFKYWLEENADCWDEPTSGRYAWPLKYDTPQRMASEYKKYIMDRITNTEA